MDEPADGVLKSGMPALVDIPAPHMMTMFLNLPSDKPESRSVSENDEDSLEEFKPIILLSGFYIFLPSEKLEADYNETADIFIVVGYFFVVIGWISHLEAGKKSSWH